LVGSGISKLGFSREDIPALVAGTLPQERVTKLSPNPVGAAELEAIFEGAMDY
jgi:hydroxyacid-oxoacid transhydrogenase